MRKITTRAELYEAYRATPDDDTTEAFQNTRFNIRKQLGEIPLVPDYIHIPYELFGHETLQRMQKKLHFFPAAKPPYIYAYVTTKHREEDRYTKIKLGRYLRRVYPRVCDESIADVIAAYQYHLQPPKLKIATTEAEITTVYKNGPSSCMSGNDWVTHPSIVYATEDFAVAYITDNRDRITARTVVFQPNKTYYRIYGDKIRLTNALKAVGYTQGDEYYAVGGKLQKIDMGDGILCPYIDGVCCLKIDDNYLVIDPASPHHATRTDGHLEICTSTCCNCNKPTWDQQCIDGIMTHVCYDCFQTHYVTAIDYHSSNSYAHRDHIVTTTSGIRFTNERAAINNGYRYQTPNGLSRIQPTHEPLPTT